MGGSSTSTRRFLSTLLACSLLGAPAVAVLGLATPAAAQPGAAQRSEEAKQRYMKGVELHDEGDYQSALIEFRRSYELVPNFNVLFNVGQEYFNLADYANALKTFQQYMEEGGKRIPPNRKEQVEGYIEKLKSRVATMNVKVNVQGAELRIDDQVIAAVIPGNVLVSTGKRRIEVSKQGFRTQTKTEEFAGQETKEVSFELQPEAVISQGGDGSKPPIVIIGDQKVTTSEPGPPIAPIVMWSLTGALGIGTGVFGGLALANQSSLDELKREPGHTTDELDDAASKARNMAIATDVFLGATVIAAGVSIYFTVDAALTPSKKKDDKAPPPPAAKVSVGPGYVGVTSSF